MYKSVQHFPFVRLYAFEKIKMGKIPLPQYKGETKAKIRRKSCRAIRSSLSINCDEHGCVQPVCVSDEWNEIESWK